MNLVSLTFPRLCATLARSAHSFGNNIDKCNLSALPLRALGRSTTIARGGRSSLTSMVEGALVLALFSPLIYSQNPPPGQCAFDRNQNKCVVQGGTFCQAGNGNGQGTCSLAEGGCWCLLPGYTLALSPFTPSPVTSGQQATSTVTITPAPGSGGTLGDVTLSVVSCPAPITCSLGANPVTSNGGVVTSTLTAAVAPSAQNGQVTISVTASVASANSAPTNGAQSATLAITRQPTVWGFADLHTHPASFLGFGADSNGENGIIWGKPAHDFAKSGGCVPWLTPHCTAGLDQPTSWEAANLQADLPPCASGSIPLVSGFTHNNRVGSDPVKFITDCLAVSSLDQTSPGWVHETSGYPSFSWDNAHGWQAALTVDHQIMHIDNIYRAFQGGLRLMFAASNENEVISGLWNQGINAGGNKMPAHTQPSRFDHDSAAKQLTYITNLVEANGSWMQIVKTPAEARDAIGHNKLAVVLSVEMDSLSFFDVQDLVQNLGVRHVIPVHLADNPVFGGTAIYSDEFNGLSNFINGAPEKWLPDPNVNFALSAQVQQLQPMSPSTTMPFGAVTAPVSVGAVATAMGFGAEVALCEVTLFGWSPCPEGVFGYVPLPLSITPGPRQLPGQINSMDLAGCAPNSDLSDCTFLKLMKMGLLLDIVHMGQKSASTALGLAQRYQYPVMDSHTGLRCDGPNPPWSKGPTSGFPAVPCESPGSPFGPVAGPAPLPIQTQPNRAQPIPIGKNATASTPFAVEDQDGNPYVYFQGTDNALWKVGDDGTNQPPQYHIGENMPAGMQYTASTPFVLQDPKGPGAWIYYQRLIDKALLKIRDNGSQLTPIGNNTTASTPYVVRDPQGVVWVYFQGTDNALWRVKDDGSGQPPQYHVGENTTAGKQYTASMPYAVPDSNGGFRIYYQRAGDKALMRIKDDGSQLMPIGNNTTASTPFVRTDPNGNWVYFQGTDNALWKVRDDGSQQPPQYHIGENMPAGKQYTVSSPYVNQDARCGGTWIYYQHPTDNALWTIRDDGTMPMQIGNITTAASPFVTPDGWVYFRGTDNTLWKVQPAAQGGLRFDERSLPVSQLDIIRKLGGVIGLGEVPRRLDDQQTQIGNNSTASAPFVLPDLNAGSGAAGSCPDLSRAWVYFQGTDNALWKVRDDGSQQNHIGENTPAGKQYTASSPSVIRDPTGSAWIYYQGTDNTLWKIRDDGTLQSRIGNNTTASTPYLVRDPQGVVWVYFRGTDNALWKLKDDGTSQPPQYHIGDSAPAGKQYTASMPFVLRDANGAGAWIYYQRFPDGALLKIRDDGSQLTPIGSNTTASTPYVVRDAQGVVWVYFQGIDNALWRVKDDGSGQPPQYHIGDNMPAQKQYTASMPFVVPDAKGAWVYYQGTDNTLWRIRDDGSLQLQINNNTTASSPFVTPDGWIYFRGTDAGFLNAGKAGTLWKTPTTSVDPDPVTTWINDYARALSLMGGKGVALGTDADGLSPLIHQDVIPTQYPFTLDLACPSAASCPAQKLYPYTFGQRQFDFQSDGIANYGLLPDFIQAASQLRPGFLGGSTAPTEQIKALFHSAEDTIAMWEMVTTSAANIKP